VFRTDYCPRKIGKALKSKEFQGFRLLGIAVTPPRKGQGAGFSSIIKKVRLTKPEGSILPIRGKSAYVKPGGLHHVSIFEYLDETGKTLRDAVFVSMFEASDRLKKKQLILQRAHPKRSNARFLFSLSMGEMVLATFKGQERLVFFSTGASTSGQMTFFSHTDARKSKGKKFTAYATTLKARKVSVDPLGRLRWAND
jgi:hypothetical protein